MDAELKAKWVAALRSGEYRQGCRFLLTESGAMCCLGVLREVASPGNRDSSMDNNKMPTLEQRVLWFGTFDNSGVLADMNDAGSTFSEIADYIEANL